MSNTIPNREEIQSQLANKQVGQKLHHDARTKCLPRLYTGQDVTHRDPKTGKWHPAVVNQKLKEPRSYELQTPSGQHLRRTREQIREAPRDDTPGATTTTSVNQAHSSPAKAQRPQPSPVSASPGKPETISPPGTPAQQPSRTTQSGRTVTLPARFRD